MTPEATHSRHWLATAALTVAAAAMVAGSLVALASPAEAQFGRRQGSPDAFNPFGIFGPLFEKPRRERSIQRKRNIQRKRAIQRKRRAAPVDHSKAPPPQKRDTTPVRHVLVMGTSLSDWLAYGLEEIYSDRPEVGIVRKNHLLTGLVRFDSKGETTWPEVAREFLKDQNPDVIVALFGLEDRRPIRERVPAEDEQKQEGQKNSPSSAKAKAKPRPRTRSFEFRTDEWAEAYAKRIDEMIAVLKSKGAPVIWVGLPAIRGTRSTSDMIYLNNLFRARAERAGIVYVDVWDGFVNESGRYTTFGPDVEGQVRRLRTSEGVFLTKAGARKLAHYVERDIKRVMGTRLQLMSVPLDESGQPTVSGPATRPVAGPVVSLTDAAGDSQLLGGAAQPTAADPLAERVLVKGAAVIPQNGRADNFFLTPEAAEAAKVAATPVEQAPEPTAPETVSVVVPAEVATVSEQGAVVAADPTPGNSADRSEARPVAGVDPAQPVAPRNGAPARRQATPSADERTRQRSRARARQRPVPPRNVGPSQRRRPPRPPIFDPFGLFR